MLTLPLGAEAPRAFVPLLKPARYKGAHGGRGGAKSHFFAEQLVLRCYSEPTRAVCIREIQNSLKESVRQLLIDKIEKFGIGTFFDVTKDEIRGANGSLIIFRGMQSYNAQTIKSLEGYDIAWVEEAQTFSAVSLRMLRPTIRKPGSELWFSWNPRFDTDPVDSFFRGGAKPPNSECVEVNWNDNPWLPDELHLEREHDYANDPEMAEHVWGGGYEIISEGSYYAKLLFAAEKEGRIGWFPHNPALKVKTAWDIGVDDHSAVWFIQDDGYIPTVVDYYETSGDGPQQIIEAALPELLLDDAMRAAQMIEADRKELFNYAVHYLPHDVKVREWGAGARERSLTLMALGVKPIHKGAQQGPAERINATRRLLPIMRFHNTKRVQKGVTRLRRYSRKWNEPMQTFVPAPQHDPHSHGADAIGEYCVNCGIVPPKPAPPPKRVLLPGQVMLPPPPEPSSGTRIRV